MVLFVPLLVIAFAAPAQANHAWGPYHWARTANPFTLKVVNSVTSQWETALSGAVSDWNSSSVLNLTTEQGDEGSQGRRKCNPIAGKVRVCNQTYGNNGWLGIANIWLTTGNHIAQATTKLNDSYHNSAPYNQPEWRAFVTCQEIGHDFGLDHQDVNYTNPNLGSCMDYTNTPLGPPANTHPNTHDYDQLQTMYGHADSFNSYGVDLRSLPTKWDPQLQVGGDETSEVGVFISRDGPYIVVTHIYYA